MEFWHDLITEKSFEILKNIKSKYGFILIGGWAVYFYTRSLKSKDIDIVVDFKNLEQIKNDFSVFKNDGLKKYECKISDIDIDIYASYYSNPGIPAEDIKGCVSKIEGFDIASPELLLILKQKAFLSRSSSIKGQKDKIDIASLIMIDSFNFPLYLKLLKKYHLENYKDELISIVNKTKEVPELRLNRNKFAKFKKVFLKKI